MSKWLMSRFFLVNQKLAVQPGYSQIPKRLTFMSWFLVNQWHKGQPNDSHALVLLVSQKHTTWPGYADLQINDSHELFLVNQQHKAQLEKSDPQANSQVKSSHLYLYSAFNNTNCNKALHNIKIGKFVNNVKWQDLTLNYLLNAFHYWI